MKQLFLLFIAGAKSKALRAADEIVRLTSRARSKIKALKLGGNTRQCVLFATGFLLFLSFTSCSTTRTIPTQIVEHTLYDTCYINTLQYDSIYLYEGRDFRLNTNLTNHTNVDTLVLTKIQYKYKLLRDTIKEVRVDTIPVIKEVEVTKEVRYTPSIYKWSLGICITLILAVILYLLSKFKKL